VPIKTSFPEGQESDLIQTILDTTGQTVLICWEQHYIPAPESLERGAAQRATLPIMTDTF
jgi:hypothetical protein